jgi:hypothetical protein
VRFCRAHTRRAQIPALMWRHYRTPMCRSACKIVHSRDCPHTRLGLTAHLKERKSWLDTTTKNAPNISSTGAARLHFRSLSTQSQENPQAHCVSLQTSLDLGNTTILNTTYIAAPTNVTTPGICRSSTPVTTSPLCRVQFVINTTSTSAVHG